MLPLGVQYVACDVAELPELGRFDLVTAAYLFNYAASPRDVGRMCARIGSDVGVGGELVCLVPRPGLTPRPVAETWRYGFGIEEVGRSPRSTELRVTLFTDPPIEVANRVFDTEVYQERDTDLRGAKVPLTGAIGGIGRTLAVELAAREGVSWCSPAAGRMFSGGWPPRWAVEPSPQT